MNTVSASRISLVIPDKLADQYQKQADLEGKSLEEMIALRLERCANHQANRPLYFNDSERQKLEKALGGGVLQTAEAAIKRLNQIFSFRLTDPKGKELATIQLDDLLIERLGSRAGVRNQSVSDYISVEIKRALMEHCNL